MQEFTGYEYIKIDIANQYGMDKELFETRINWVDENMDQLESLMDEADEPILYIKAVMALRDAQNVIPTGHIMGLDACSSGLQIMGALIGCEVTARNTGLVDPNARADIYSTTTDVMNNILKDMGLSVEPTRKEVKLAQMTFFYGSQAKPKEIFGEETPELEGFYKAQYAVAPGACELMDYMLATWKRDALTHEWVLPDGFHTRVKVMYDVDLKVEVDELGGTTFTHRFQENIITNDYAAKQDFPVKDGVANAANIVHSIDGMIVREMGRRCNYEEAKLRKALTQLNDHLNSGFVPAEDYPNNFTNFISMVHVEDIDTAIATLTFNDLWRLRTLIEQCLEYRSFPMICVHDEFKCSPNHMNQLRKHYIEIFAELADSNLMEDILNQIHGSNETLQKHTPNLSEKIRQSNYMLS